MIKYTVFIGWLLALDDKIIYHRSNVYFFISIGVCDFNIETKISRINRNVQILSRAPDRQHCSSPLFLSSSVCAVLLSAWLCGFVQMTVLTVSLLAKSLSQQEALLAMSLVLAAAHFYVCVRFAFVLMFGRDGFYADMSA